MKIILILLVTGLLCAQAHAEPKIGVAVWDDFFDRQSADRILDYFDGHRNGTLQDVFYWDAATEKQDAKMSADSTGYNSHGFKTSFVVADGQPFVDIYSVFNSYLPWQDPELCRLLDFPSEPAIEKGLPDCRDLAEQGVAQLSAFIKSHNIRVLNLSAGTYYGNYTPNNRLALQKSFPSADVKKIDLFLLKNFLMIGHYVETLIDANPGVFFVFAAGNFDNLDVDRQIFPDFDPDSGGKTGLPIWYASIAEKHANSIAVTAGSPDVDPSSSAFIDDAFGKLSVSMAIRNPGVRVPTSTGMEDFRGTSSAAAELSHILARAHYMYAEKNLKPSYLKQALVLTVDHYDQLAPLLVTGGVMNESRFFAKLQSDLGPPLHAYQPPVPYPSVHSGELYVHRFWDSIRKSDRAFEEYPFHSVDSIGNPTGCLILKVAADGDVWMTLPGLNQVGQFKQDSKQLITYEAMSPITPSGPDGLTIDSQGRVWVAEYDAGKMMMIDPNMIDPSTGKPQMREFATQPSLNVAIPTIDSHGKMWITSHQAKKLFEFDPVQGAYLNTISLDVGWPLDVLADASMIWVSGNTRFTLGNTQNGALVRYNPSTQAIDYYGLPASIYDGQINGYWLAQTDSQVFMTLGKQGVFAVDKKGGEPFVYDQREGTKYFFTAASLTSKDEVAFSNGSDAGSLAIQIYNPTVDQNVLSTYLLPTQSGQFSEGLTYDQRNGDVWYCERNPPVLGVLRHQSLTGVAIR